MEEPFCHPHQTLNELEAILADLEKEAIEHAQLLRTTIEDAHQASLVISELLTIMSREIQPSVDTVLGMSQHMQDSDLDANQRRYAKTISQSGLSLIDTLNNALDLTGTKAGFLKISEHSSHNTRDASSLIDVDYVNEMKKGFQVSVFNSLLQQYCRDAENALYALERAVDKHDLAEAQNLLHLLKGCSANFGASAIAQLCENHRTQLKQYKDISKADIAHLKQVYDNTKEQLLQAAG